MASKRLKMETGINTQLITNWFQNVFFKLQTIEESLHKFNEQLSCHPIQMTQSKIENSDKSVTKNKLR